MRARAEKLAWAALAAAALLAAGCVPSPRSFAVGPRPQRLRIAMLPLANYSTTRDAPDRLAPILAAELGRQPGVEIVDAGAVDAALVEEPWLLTDRLPPDLVDSLASALGADVLLVGSVLGFEYRESGGDRIPQLSVALRMVEAPGGRVLWSAVQSRDGADGEWLFGLGRVRSLEQLAENAVEDLLATLPAARAGQGAHADPLAEGKKE